MAGRIQRWKKSLLLSKSIGQGIVENIIMTILSINLELLFTWLQEHVYIVLLQEEVQID